MIIKILNLYNQILQAVAILDETLKILAFIFFNFDSSFL